MTQAEHELWLALGELRTEVSVTKAELSTERQLRTTMWNENSKAVSLAVDDINRRLDDNNHFREQLVAERAEYLTKDMYEREYNPLQGRVGVVEKTYVQRDLFDTTHSTTGEKIATIEKQSLSRDAYDREHSTLANRVAALELMASKVSGTYWAMGAMISAVVGIVTVLAHIYFK